MRGRRFVVEDEPDIRPFLDAALTEEGYIVAHAGNGAEALASIRDCRPDLILLDLLMPVMDGRTFVRLYRNQPGPHVPIIAISPSTKVLGGAGKPHGGDEAEAGVRRTRAEVNAKLPEVEAHLDKPFDLDALLATMARVLDGAPEQP